MKSFTIYEALTFLLTNGYVVDNINAIGYSDREKNSFEFTAITLKGNQLTINLDEETIIVEPYKEI